MSVDSSILLYALQGTVALLLVSGAASGVAGWWSSRLSTMFGALGAGVACLGGLAVAILALVGRVAGTLAWPWSLPYGSFQVGLDPLSAFFLVPTFLLAGLAAIYSLGYFKPWKNRNPGRFWFFYNALVASMAIVLTARNGVLFLVAWEAMALASFFLVVFDDEEASTREAGWIYLVATHIGTAFLIALFILLGRASGSQDFAAYAVPAGRAGGLFLLALIGFGTKAGLFPLHVWLPEAHPAAPSPVSAVMSGVMIKTGIYGIVRTLVFLGAVPGWCAWAVLGLGVATGLIGILFALAQRDLKRVLAYSSVENVGIVFLGLGLGLVGMHRHLPVLAVLGFAGAFLHIWNHALFKGLLFLGAGAVVQATGTRNLESLGGLLKRMPWTGATFLAGAIAICSLPPFNGFAGEFLMYAGAFKAMLGRGPSALVGLVVLLALGLIGGLAAACFARAFGIAFLGEPRSPASASAREVAASMRAPMVVLAVLCLAIGLFAGWVLRFLEPAVAQVSGLSLESGGLWVTTLNGWLFPVSLGALLLLLLALVWALAVLRRRLLAPRAVRETVTWDCGYAAPAPSMQYTAASFAQPLTRGAQAILRPERNMRLPCGIYPGSSSHDAITPDGASRFLFAPLFVRARDLFTRLHPLQHGQVHLYILYIVVTLMVLLAWALWS
jgi:formate hydrogenlyase subunit 3/multisubunit Na+/H+ antiporter MnhD subunit